MKPIYKWIIGIALFLLVALLSTAWYLSIKWKPLLDSKIKALVIQATDSLYTVDYDHFQVNLALGNLTISNLKIVPDTTIYKKLELVQKAPDNRYEIAINRLRLKSLGIRKVLMDKELSLSDITIDTPSIHVINSYHRYNDTISEGPKKPLYEKIKENLRKIQVNTINLNKINFRYSQLQKGIYQNFEIKKVNVKVQDILIDSASMNDAERFYHTKMIDIDIPGFTYKTPDGYYKIDFDKLRINTKQRDVLMTKIVYQPILNKADFYRHRGKGGAYITFRLDTLHLKNFNFGRLSRDKKIYAQKVLAKNGAVSIYSDKHYKSPPQRQIGKAPHLLLKKMNSRIGIDTLLLEDFGVAYSEKSDKYNQVGTITFDHTFGTITNLTNDQTILAQRKVMQAKLSSMFMDAGKLLVTFGFDMQSKDGAYTYKGSLGAMDARLVNKMIRPLLNVEIKSGNIRGVAFDISANEYRSKGTFKLDYDDVKINLLSDVQEDGTRKKKGLLSFVVNQVLFNPANPDAKGVYIIGHINKRRDPTHPFFKAMWQTLLVGIKQCVGLDAEREAKLMNTADKVKKVVTAVDSAKGFISDLFKKNKTPEELEKERQDKAEKKKVEQDKK